MIFNNNLVLLITQYYNTNNIDKELI